MCLKPRWAGLLCLFLLVSDSSVFFCTVAVFLIRQLKGCLEFLLMLPPALCLNSHFSIATRLSSKENESCEVCLWNYQIYSPGCWFQANQQFFSPITLCVNCDPKGCFSLGADACASAFHQEVTKL